MNQPPREKWSLSRIRFGPALVDTIGTGLFIFGGMAIIGLPIEQQDTPKYLTAFLLWNLFKQLHPSMAYNRRPPSADLGANGEQPARGSVG